MLTWEPRGGGAPRWSPLIRLPPRQPPLVPYTWVPPPSHPRRGARARAAAAPPAPGEACSRLPFSLQRGPQVDGIWKGEPRVSDAKAGPAQAGLPAPDLIIH